MHHAMYPKHILFMYHSSVAPLRYPFKVRASQRIMGDKSTRNLSIFYRRLRQHLVTSDWQLDCKYAQAKLSGRRYA